MNDFEMKYKGSELEALVEGSASSLFYAGTVVAAYSIPGRTAAQVTVSQAFRTKYNIGENKEVFYIVDKRTIAGDDSNEVYIYPADFEGCYFVMGDFEGNDAIFGLGATKGDWVVVQGREWVKIATQQREIAGISGNVTAEALAQKLSTPTLENTKPLATKEEILQSDWLDKDTTSKAFVKNKPFGVIALTPIIQLNLSADTIGTDISILSGASPFYVAGSVYYAKDVLDQDIVINTAGEDLKVRVVKEGDNYYLRHVSGRTQVEDIAFISNVKLQKLSSGYISDEIARTKDFYTKEEVDSKKQDILSLTVKDNGNIVIGNINGQSKEFMPATPSGDPRHYMYLKIPYVEYNEATGLWSYMAKYGGLTDITTDEMSNMYEITGGGTNKRDNYGRWGRYINQYYPARTNICTTFYGDGQGYVKSDWNYAFNQNPTIEVAVLINGELLHRTFSGNQVAGMFRNCSKLRKIIGRINFVYIKTSDASYQDMFNGCKNLEELSIMNLNRDLSLAQSSKLSLEAITEMIYESASGKTFTLIFHADVYNKCIEGGEWYSEVKSALDSVSTDKNTIITIASA